jgi:hypothetical protein
MESYIYKMLGATLVTLGKGISDAALAPHPPSPAPAALVPARPGRAPHLLILLRPDARPHRAFR